MFLTVSALLFFELYAISAQYIGNIGLPCATSATCGACAVCQTSICSCAPGCQQVGSSCSSFGGFGQQGFSGGLSFIQPGAGCGSGSFGICGGGSFCNGGSCSCPTGAILQNSVCVTQTATTIAYPGQSCGSYSQCGGGSFCNSGMCGCPSGYIISQNTCVTSTYTSSVGNFGGIGIGPYGGFGAGFGGGFNGGFNGGCVGGIAYPGQSCAGGCSCGGGASCVSSVCNCPSNCIIQNNICIPQQPYFPVQQQQAIAMSIPIIVSIQLGSPCGPTQQCTSVGATCVQNTCQCGSSWYQQGQVCFRKKTS